MDSGRRGTIIHEVYIDGPCGSKTLVGVLLARFRRVSHVTHFYEDQLIRVYAVCLGSGISQLKCLQYDWAIKFNDYKKCLANNLSIDLLMSTSHGPSRYTLSLDTTLCCILVCPLAWTEAGALLLQDKEEITSKSARKMPSIAE